MTTLGRGLAGEGRRARRRTFVVPQNPGDAKNHLSPRLPWQKVPKPRSSVGLQNGSEPPYGPPYGHSLYGTCRGRRRGSLA